MEKTQREKKELEFFLNMDQGKKVSIVLEGISLANEVTEYVFFNLTLLQLA